MRLLLHYLLSKWQFTRLAGERLAHFHDKRAQQIVTFAIRNSPYYAERFGGWDGHNWRSLPVTDKQAMMVDFGRFNTRRIPADIAMETALRAERDRDFRPTVPGTDLTVGLSSGTSGYRGLFLVSPQERAAWAGTLLARALPGPLLRLGGWRIAFIHRSGSNLYESLSSRVIQFRFFDLMTPLAEVVASLNHFQPHILTAPPTLLGMLAEERRAGRLRITPERILSVAEVLEPQDAKTIADAFTLPAVDQIYQCTEGLLGVSCSHHRLHWQEDVVAGQFEALDSPVVSPPPATQRVPGPPPADGGRSVFGTGIDSEFSLPSPRQRGEGRVPSGWRVGGNGTLVTPILTDLWRTTQPIIRYRLGDVLSLAPEGRCPCGSSFRVIEQVQGRKDDVCQFPTIVDAKVLRPFFPDTLRRAVLLAHGGIGDYRLVQEKPGALRVFLALTEEAKGKDSEVLDSVRRSLEETFARYGCRAEEIALETGIPEQADPRAKRRRVIRLG